VLKEVLLVEIGVGPALSSLSSCRRDYKRRDQVRWTVRGKVLCHTARTASGGRGNQRGFFHLAWGGLN